MATERSTHIARSVGIAVFAQRADPGLTSCAETTEEALEIPELGPELPAIEPSELTGTGLAVSRARRERCSRRPHIPRRRQDTRGCRSEGRG